MVIFCSYVYCICKAKFFLLIVLSCSFLHAEPHMCSSFTKIWFWAYLCSISPSFDLLINIEKFQFLIYDVTVVPKYFNFVNICISLCFVFFPCQLESSRSARRKKIKRLMRQRGKLQTDKVFFSSNGAGEFCVLSFCQGILIHFVKKYWNALHSKHTQPTLK